MMRHGDCVGVRMRGDQHGGGADHGIVVFGETFTAFRGAQIRIRLGGITGCGLRLGCVVRHTQGRSAKPTVGQRIPPCVRFDGGFRPSFPGCAQLRIQVVEPCGEFFRKATGVTNTRVVWCFSTSSSTLRSMAGHTEPPVETREVCSSPRPKSVLYVPPMPPWQDHPGNMRGMAVRKFHGAALRLRRRRRDRAWPKAVPPLSDPCRGAIRV